MTTRCLVTRRERATILFESIIFAPRPLASQRLALESDQRPAHHRALGGPQVEKPGLEWTLRHPFSAQSQMRASRYYCSELRQPSRKKKCTLPALPVRARPMPGMKSPSVSRLSGPSGRRGLLLGCLRVSAASFSLALQVRCSSARLRPRSLARFPRRRRFRFAHMGDTGSALAALKARRVASRASAAAPADAGPSAAPSAPETVSKLAWGWRCSGAA